MPKPVTPREMFDLWQKMVNPGAFPLQSLMFPVLDAREIEKKIVELETVEHWLKANLNLLRLSIQSLEYQRSLLEGGEKAAAAMKGEGEADAANPAMWAWNMMAQAGKSMADAAQNAARPAGEAVRASAAAPAHASKPKGSRKRSR
jgi:peptidoglycan hydrolase CwlO-like protein